MRVSSTTTVTATSGVPILQYWWLIAGVGGIFGIIVVGGAVAYQESERQKLLALAFAR